jgi:hypothetical protein
MYTGVYMIVAMAFSDREVLEFAVRVRGLEPRAY